MAACNNAHLRFPVPAVSPLEPYRTETVERGSRFLAQTCRCGGIGPAREFLALIRAKNPDATHNCWAFVAGYPGDTSRIGFSDDGEPHGTAGRPMLKVLLHSGIGEICVVVSRWFGGVKLGTGGLVRAYQDSVVNNLRELPLTEYKPEKNLRIEIEYARLDGMKRLLPKYEGSIIKEEYQSKVSLLVSMPEDRIGSFRGEAADASNGSAIITSCDPV